MSDLRLRTSPTRRFGLRERGRAVVRRSVGRSVSQSAIPSANLNLRAAGSSGDPGDPGGPGTPGVHIYILLWPLMSGSLGSSSSWLALRPESHPIVRQQRLMLITDDVKHIESIIEW
mmetsp:Transcript_10247/g.15311  ORF Transcript_10247/g.15311 Transcript_10247/m.15311 type:complete len:117 (-) Transcript_10247:249-599(-)